MSIKISGFTSVGKTKNVSPVCMITPSGIAIDPNSLQYTIAFNGEDDPHYVYVPDLRKYKYLFGYVEASNGVSGFCIVPVGDNVTVHNYDYEYRDMTLFFTIEGIGQFNVMFYTQYMNTVSGIDIFVNSYEEEFSFTENNTWIETQFDEDGNYVSGTVFYLV